MKIAIIGAGNIGGNLAKQFAKAGYEVYICFSRSESALRDKAAQIGHGVQAASVQEAVAQSEVIVLAAQWAHVDAALAQAGNLEGKVVIDATNQYGPDGLANLAVSVADHNQKRLPRAHLIRAFNMLTASDQAAVAEGRHSPAAMFYAAEDDRAKEIAEQLIPSTSFTPVYLGGWNNVSHIEAPDFLLGRLYTVERAQKIASLIQSHKLDAAKALAQQDQ